MPNTPGRAQSSYLDNETLRALIRDYRKTKTASDALGAAFLKIAGGIWDRYRFTPDREDFCQECAIHLLGRPLEKIHIQKHCFNYLTTCVIRFGMKLRDKDVKDAKRFRTYAAELAESGREIPIVEPDRHGGRWTGSLGEDR